jgi:hypothetical protein
MKMELRILKELWARFSELRIVKDLGKILCDPFPQSRSVTPYTPGHLDGYQKKGDKKGDTCNCMKTKG